MNFKEKVFNATKKVPKGKVSTYKKIAEDIGKPRAFRAVGNSLKTNTSKLVPCHRVIKSDGTLGGYRWGLKRKKELLMMEGVEIKNGKVDLIRFLSA